MGIHPTGGLAEALTSCGIEPSDVEVDRDDLCQEDVLSFSTATITHSAFAALAELYLSFPSRFVFGTEELQHAFQDAVSKSPRMVALREQLRADQYDWLAARGLASFPPFDPESESVSDFAARVEIACGVGKGELLSVHGNEAVSIDPREPDKLTADHTRTLLALLEICAPNLPASSVVQVTGDVR